MSNPIPSFDHNLVIPPHMGNPANPSDLSPYKCTSYELCERFSTSLERVDILRKFLLFRGQLNDKGLVQGFQWLDGSFLEDIESREQRAPRDLDTVTIYWGYNIDFQKQLMESFPEFADNKLSKSKFNLDHYPFDASFNPYATVDYTRYWIQLFSHNRDSVWKGMLQIELNTKADDDKAMGFLNGINFHYDKQA